MSNRSPAIASRSRATGGSAPPGAWRPRSRSGAARAPRASSRSPPSERDAMETFTTTHWGSYRVDVEQGRLVGVRPVAWDRHPSPIGQSLPDTVHGPSRVRRPAVRAGFLEKGAASREGRGSEPFVEVSWDEATTLVANEIERVRRERGNEAIFGGSYGWSSAGRFHHAQSQVHRFLNTTLGGYVRSVNSYSAGASGPMLPHLIG